MKWRATPSLYRPVLILWAVKKAQLCAASSLAELDSLDAKGKILLLHGEIAKEQLMPPSFPFYNPDEHKEIYRLLERSGARAVPAATSRNPEIGRWLYPFPLIEDGDFPLPPHTGTASQAIDHGLPRQAGRRWPWIRPTVDTTYYHMRRARAGCWRR